MNCCMLCAVLYSETTEKLMTTKHNKRHVTAYLFKCVFMYEVEFALFQLHTYLC